MHIGTARNGLVSACYLASRCTFGVSIPWHSLQCTATKEGQEIDTPVVHRELAKHLLSHWTRSPAACVPSPGAHRTDIKMRRPITGWTADEQYAQDRRLATVECRSRRGVSPDLPLRWSVSILGRRPACANTRMCRNGRLTLVCGLTNPDSTAG